MKTEDPVGRDRPMIQYHLEIANILSSQQSGDLCLAGKLRINKVIEAPIETPRIILESRGRNIGC
jgi:hypothetical protein